MAKRPRRSDDENEGEMVSDRIILTIGDDVFHTTQATLGASSYFKAMFESFKEGSEGSIYIDRDGQIFGYLLYFMRTGELFVLWISIVSTSIFSVLLLCTK
jgi:hypothetical protein